MHAVELDRVSKRFASNWAMKDVAFTAGQGEFVSLLGPSGCGKTTTLRVVAGFETPSEGDIRLAGETVDMLPPWKRDIGVVFQTYALFPYLKASENVAFGLKMRRLPGNEIQRRVDDALAMVGLSGLGDRYPRQMSGGQRQRVALARAMVIEPRLLLLDEPLSNLDAKLRGEMRLEVKRLQRESGITTIFVTHDQEEAFSLSDKIVLMNAGKVCQIGAPQEIWNAPNSRFAADFIGIENLLAATLERLDGKALVRLEGGQALATAAAGDRKAGPIVAAIRATDIRIATDDHPAAVNGRILDADYRGDSFALRIETALADTPITVKVPSSTKPAGAVKLVFPPEKLMVLDRD